MELIEDIRETKINCVKLQILDICVEVRYLKEKKKKKQVETETKSLFYISRVEDPSWIHVIM